MRKEIYTEVKKVVNTTGKFLLTQFNKVPYRLHQISSIVRSGSRLSDERGSESRPRTLRINK
jgi:hypothetical protein